MGRARRRRRHGAHWARHRKHRVGVGVGLIANAPRRTSAELLDLDGGGFALVDGRRVVHGAVPLEQVASRLAEQGPTDGLMGAGFVEIRLTRMLG
jgi:hypothetical protein